MGTGGAGREPFGPAQLRGNAEVQDVVVLAPGMFAKPSGREPNCQGALPDLHSVFRRGLQSVTMGFLLVPRAAQSPLLSGLSLNH